MIKSNDLRIGNFLTVNGIIGKVDWIQKESISVTYLERQENLVNGIITYEDNLEPIPLTPEILEKCGFSVNDISSYAKLGTFEIYKEGEYYYFDTFRRSAVELKYLHQLQNLYYALTGEELTIFRQQK